MTIEFYKILHLAGLMSLFFGFGLLLMGFALKVNLPKKLRLMGFLAHGCGLLLILISGFGMLARLNYTSGLPGWAYAKLIIWLILGLAISVVKRKAQWSPYITICLIAIGSIAAWLALYKPF